VLQVIAYFSFIESVGVYGTVLLVTYISILSLCNIYEEKSSENTFMFSYERLPT